MNHHVVRAELEKLVWAHRYLPDRAVLLAIWYRKSDQREIHLMEAYDSKEAPQIPVIPVHLLHENNSSNWPFAEPLHHILLFSGRSQLEWMIANNDPLVGELQKDREVIFIQPDELSPSILQTLMIRTQPDGLVKGWYIPAPNLESMIQTGQRRTPDARPTVGVLQVSTLTDLDRKAGITHVEVDGRWLPSTKNGVNSYTWYTDSVQGQPGAILFEGGDLFQIKGFEIRTSMDYSRKVLSPNSGDEYIEAHLSRIPIPVHQF